MNSRVIPWTIEVEDIQIQSRVGIWDHERELQPLRISLSLRGIAPASPKTIEECLDYQPICRWITEVWPAQAHTPLLETKMRELMGFIFDYDARIEWANVAIAKTQAFENVRSVGIRMALSREDYELNFCDRKSSAGAHYPYFPLQADVAGLQQTTGVPA